MAKLQEFLSKLEAYGINPRYSLGQNFLYDPDILDALAAGCQLEPRSRVIEIGAGFGTLTLSLLADGGPDFLTAYEIDEQMGKRLADLASGDSRLIIRMEDASRADFRLTAQEMASRQAASGLVPGPLHAVGNLPYYITTPLMEKLLVTLPEASTMCFMVQAEVWGRIRALPEDGKVYGPLAVLCHSYGKIERVMELPAAVFYPAPRVNSIFVRLERHKTPDQNPLSSGEGASFLKFLNVLFAQRRKTFANNLKGSGLPTERQEAVLSKLSELGYPPSVRTEALNPVELSALFNAKP